MEKEVAYIALKFIKTKPRTFFGRPILFMDPKLVFEVTTRSPENRGKKSLVAYSLRRIKSRLNRRIAEAEIHVDDRLPGHAKSALVEIPALLDGWKTVQPKRATAAERRFEQVLVQLNRLRR
jgi:hypothetical protein